ncbi:MAG: dihydrofolate reductase [bacterium]|nr:dihydrofolate reductase [bacterium]
MISLIVAMDKNRAIGKRGELPWYLPADLARFKRITYGHPIIMGRKTFESIGRALPNRTNIIVTRKMFEVGLRTFRVASLKEAIGLASINDGGEEIFIIGGGEIFRESINLADRIYMTEVLAEVPEADVFFPAIYDKIWKEINRVHYQHDDKNEFDYNFVMYERR